MAGSYDFFAKCSALSVQAGTHADPCAAVQVVGFYGTKSVSYQEALAAIFIEGWIFIAISILGIRQRLIGLLPRYSAVMSPCRWLASAGLGAAYTQNASVMVEGCCVLPLACGAPVSRSQRDQLLRQCAYTGIFGYLLGATTSDERRTLTLAMAAGIGFFLAHIGYQAGEGIGLVVADPATLVTLGQASLHTAKSACAIALAALPRVCQHACGIWLI